MAVLPDPRFNTTYRVDFKGTPYYTHQRSGYIVMPSFVYEKWCRPGYQPVRPDKGYDLTVNDYTFHNIQYGGSLWPTVVYTDMPDDNDSPIPRTPIRGAERGCQ